MSHGIPNVTTETCFIYLADDTATTGTRTPRIVLSVPSFYYCILLKYLQADKSLQHTSCCQVNIKTT